jgi:molybdopterin synthase catalytic subunit
MHVPATPPAATGSVIRVTARLFAHYAELAGLESVPMELAPGAVVADAVAAIRRAVPNGGLIPERPLVAVNLSHAPLDRPLSEGDEVALLPPLAGG